MMTFSIGMKMILEKYWRGWGCLRVRKCVWGEFMELYLSCKWIPGLRNTSGELVVNWPESCPRSAEHPHSHNFILLDFLISSWFTFSFTRMYLNFYGPFRIQITEDRDIWRKYFKEEEGEIKHFPKVTAIFSKSIFGTVLLWHTFAEDISFLFFFKWSESSSWTGLFKESTHILRNCCISFVSRPSFSLSFPIDK